MVFNRMAGVLKSSLHSGSFKTPVSSYTVKPLVSPFFSQIQSSWYFSRTHRMSHCVCVAHQQMTHRKPHIETWGALMYLLRNPNSDLSPSDHWDHCATDWKFPPDNELRWQKSSFSHMFPFSGIVHLPLLWQVVLLYFVHLYCHLCWESTYNAHHSIINSNGRCFYFTFLCCSFTF